MRRARRSVVVVALAGVVGLTAAVPAAAWRNPEAKRVKRALVAVETELDVERSRLESLAKHSDRISTRIRDAQAALRGTTSDVAGLLGVVAGFSDLGRALYARDWLQIRLARAKRRVRTLESDRAGVIKELELVVRESRIRNAGFSSSWSVDGDLITYSADWQAVAMCESSGEWHVDSKYDGGLQFHPYTWIGFGGGEFARFAFQASKMQQIAVAERVLAIQGERAWPRCFTPLPFHF